MIPILTLYSYQLFEVEQKVNGLQFINIYRPKNRLPESLKTVKPALGAGFATNRNLKFADRTADFGLKLSISVLT